MALTAADVVVPLSGYARRLHAVAGPRHHVASPLGAWLLLALCAPASQGETRESLNGVLGCDSADAAELAAGLLAAPHPVVPAAAGVWHRNTASETLARWLSGLPPQVETGPLTTQAALDDWARRHTSDLIERVRAPELDPFVAHARQVRHQQPVRQLARQNVVQRRMQHAPVVVEVVLERRQRLLHAQLAVPRLREELGQQ